MLYVAAFSLLAHVPLHLVQKAGVCIQDSGAEAVRVQHPTQWQFLHSAALNVLKHCALFLCSSLVFTFEEEEEETLIQKHMKIKRMEHFISS